MTKTIEHTATADWFDDDDDQDIDDVYAIIVHEIDRLTQRSSGIEVRWNEDSVTIEGRWMKD